MTNTFKNTGSTKIPWTQHTWNPIRGCSKISDGCDNCYAEKMSNRFATKSYGGIDESGEAIVTKDELHFKPKVIFERLKEPYKWKKSRMVFVASMGDLFHDEISEDFIRQVYKVMSETPQHIYQILTKRPERMRDIVNRLVKEQGHLFGNVWHGVTVENQKALDHRLDLLLRTKSVIHYVSAEPLLERLDFARHHRINYLDWVIVGGENGPGARVCQEDWIRTIWFDCKDADVPFFFKGTGRKWEFIFRDTKHVMAQNAAMLEWWNEQREFPKLNK